MKYKELDMQQVKKCCKKHAYKSKTGKTLFKCSECPLRRTITRFSVVSGKMEETNGFCWFVLKDIYNDLEEENEQLEDENINHEEEWVKYLMESEE